MVDELSLYQMKCLESQNWGGFGLGFFWGGRIAPVENFWLIFTKMQGVLVTKVTWILWNMMQENGSHSSKFVWKKEVCRQKLNW